MSPQTGELLVQEIAPRIRSAIANSASQVGPDDIDELVQDALAIAARMLLSAQSRQQTVTPGNVAYYAVGHVRQGRRSTGQSKTDPMHPFAQLSGRSCMVSLDAALPSTADGEEPLCLHEVLAAPTEDPAMAALRHLDWERLLLALDVRTSAVLVCLVQGEDLTTLVPKLKRSRSAIQSDKRHLARLTLAHLGQDVLKQAQQWPPWRDNVTANRERLACRYERLSA